MVSAATDITNSSGFLASHAAARVWRHLADDPDTPAKTRAALLEYLPAIEADPVGADWAAAYLVTTTTTAATFFAPEVAYHASTVTAGRKQSELDRILAAATNATRAVGLGCAGSDRIGLALTLLADQDAELTDPTTAWELSGLITQTLQEITEKAAGKTSP